MRTLSQPKAMTALGGSGRCGGEWRPSQHTPLCGGCALELSTRPGRPHNHAASWVRKDAWAASMKLRSRLSGLGLLPAQHFVDIVVDVVPDGLSVMPSGAWACCEPRMGDGAEPLSFGVDIHAKVLRLVLTMFSHAIRC